MNKVSEFVNIYIYGKGSIKNPLLQKYQPFFLPVISLIFCTILLTLVTIPQLLSLVRTYGTLSDINASQKELNDKLSSLKKINPDEYKTDLDTALIALPPDKDVPGIIDQILILLSGSGLHLGGISFDNGSDSTVQTENYAVRLSVNGTIDQLKAFIEKTKSAPRIMKINSIETNGRTSGLLDITLSLAVFYHPLPADVPTNNASIPLLSDSDINTLKQIRDNASTIPVLSPANISNIKTGKSDPFQ